MCPLCQGKKTLPANGDFDAPAGSVVCGYCGGTGTASSTVAPPPQKRQQHAPPPLHGWDKAIRNVGQDDE